LVVDAILRFCRGEIAVNREASQTPEAIQISQNLQFWSEYYLFPAMPTKIAKKAIRKPPFCRLIVMVAPRILPFDQFVQKPNFT
jgi:hypothetical protein